MNNLNNSIDSLDELFDKIELIKNIKVNIIKSNQINSFKDACNVLNENFNIQRTSQEKLEIIIKAANFLDNDMKIWKADFLNQNIKKYINYFIRNSSGWVFGGVDFHIDCSYCLVGFYFKEEDTAKLIANRFIELYNKVLG